MNETYKKWLEDGCPKVYCHCPNHEEIIITKWHKHNGIPKYILGHQFKGENHPMFGKTGENSYWFGKHHSKETIEKISEKMFGENNPMYEIHRFGEEAPHFGKYHSKESIEKMSKNRKGKCCGEENPAFNNWSSKGEYCWKWTEEVRENTRNKYDRKCFLCGKSEEEQMNEMKEQGKRQFRLSIHHIDSDKEQGCNGKSWKLVPLCIHCHGKVHGHKIIIKGE